MGIKIHGKDYMTVNERINILHDLYPNCSVKTEIISDDEQTIIMKATITIKDIIYPGVQSREQIFTGHAQEFKNSTQINTTSAYENCETSAIGRACGFMGIGIIESVASVEEVKTAIHQQNNEKIDQNYIPFKKGPNTGKMIHEIPIDALEWIVNESKMREEIKNIADKVLQEKYDNQDTDDVSGFTDVVQSINK